MLHEISNLSLTYNYCRVQLRHDSYIDVNPRLIIHISLKSQKTFPKINRNNGIDFKFILFHIIFTLYLCENEHCNKTEQDSMLNGVQLQKNNYEWNVNILWLKLWFGSIFITERRVQNQKSNEAKVHILNAFKWLFHKILRHFQTSIGQKRCGLFYFSDKNIVLYRSREDTGSPYNNTVTKHEKSQVTVCSKRYLNSINLSSANVIHFELRLFGSDENNFVLGIYGMILSITKCPS